MLPMFNEYIKYLKDKDVDVDALGLKEGVFWLSRNIIKGFDENGEIVKIARVGINDDLTITCKVYGSEYGRLETWEETVTRNKDMLLELEEHSLNVIRKSIRKYRGYRIILLTSGGKDSTLTDVLLTKADINFDRYFNNTTLDCADTYRFIKKQDNLTIMNPKKSFYIWSKESNYLPTRFARACCDKFKEGETHKFIPRKEPHLIFLGMRNEESPQRSEYQDEWVNNKWGKLCGWKGILPIRQWKELDVWLYFLMNNIEFNGKYRKGYTRVGCAVACPYYTKSTWILDKYWYPTMYNRWQERIKDDFLRNNKWIVMNCTLDEYYKYWTGGVVRPEPTKEVVEEFAMYNNLDYDVAKNYFNNVCCECGKKIKDKETLSMNMKFNGRETEKLYCKVHFMDKSGLKEDDWNRYIQAFKQTGCELF